MPTFANVSYNSSRVQRAYRINNIETMKLQNNIHLLEKERLHRQRLTNQDIRLISLTLDYIQTCSGHSQEGLAPDDEPGEEVEQEKGPCFLYGERIVSRKKRRNIRPQSAMDKTSSRSVSMSETMSTVSAADTTTRPQSSPVRKRPTFVTQLRDDESQNGKVSTSESSRSGASTPRFRPAWIDAPPSDITKVLLRSSDNGLDKRRSSVFESDKEEKSGALKSLTRNLRIRSQSINDTIQNMKGSDDRPFHSGRGTRITDLLNKNKSTMSASEWKTHLGRAQSAGPVTSSLQRKSILESKKVMNSVKAGVIQTKVNRFLSDET